MLGGGKTGGFLAHFIPFFIRFNQNIEFIKPSEIIDMIEFHALMIPDLTRVINFRTGYQTQLGLTLNPQ